MMKTIRYIRKGKYHLFKNRIHRILPIRTLNFLAHLSGVSKWIDQHRDLEYSTFPQKTFEYDKRYGLYRFVIDNEIQDKEIDYLEFGVAKGESFKWWIEHIKHKDARFFGFDTFTGLPEDWGPFKKGDMSNGNEPPKIEDSRCTFYKGIFQDTLYTFLKSYRTEQNRTEQNRTEQNRTEQNRTEQNRTEQNRKKVIHLDADLYSSTLFVLTTLSPYLSKGDILLFDEFNVPLHEFKAFTEWVEAFYIRYSVIGEVNNYFQVAIRIE